MSSENDTATLAVPTDISDYRRWLAGKIGALAGRTRTVDEPVDALDAEILRDAARDLLAALDDAERQGGIQ